MSNRRGNYRGDNYGRGGKRGGGPHHNFSKPTMAPIIISSVFDIETPKAYAPLGFILPAPITVINPSDFKNDTPLPVYPQRPAQILKTPLRETFLDTESERPGIIASNLVRSLKNRKNDENSLDPSIVDIGLVFARLCEKNQEPLLLGSIEIDLKRPDSILKSILPKNKPEFPDTYTDNADENINRADDLRESKNTEIDTKEGDRSMDLSFGPHEGRIAAETVLRMVDDSLVNTPDRIKKEPKSISAQVKKQSYSNNRVAAVNRFEKDLQFNHSLASPPTGPAADFNNTSAFNTQTQSDRIKREEYYPDNYQIRDYKRTQPSEEGFFKRDSYPNSSTPSDARSRYDIPPYDPQSRANYYPPRPEVPYGTQPPSEQYARDYYDRYGRGPDGVPPPPGGAITSSPNAVRPNHVGRLDWQFGYPGQERDLKRQRDRDAEVIGYPEREAYEYRAAKRIASGPGVSTYIPQGPSNGANGKKSYADQGRRY